MATEILNFGGTQVLNSGTQVLNSGTQVLNSGTQVLGDATTNGDGKKFTGGLLTIGEVVEGWTIESKIEVVSGEADLYIATKDGEKGVVKYYRANIHPKQGILDSLLQAKHPDIINIYGYGTYKDHFYEIMEYAAGGSLDARNDDGTYKLLPLEEDKVIQICKEVVNSYKYIHEKGIIHRDIKPANIYYRDAERTDVVIGDFGISSIMDEGEFTVSHKTQTASRTTGYAAPEVLSGLISSKMDYYALGITLWELATGKDPFVMDNGKRRNDAHLIRDTIEGRIVDDLLSREPILSEKLQHLIRGLLVIDDKQRWGYDEVTRFLNGENVPVAKKAVKCWNYTLGDKNCTTLEELGSAIMENPSAILKDIYRGSLSGFLEDKYLDVTKKIDSIIEESSATNHLEMGAIRIGWLLNPNYPFKTKNGYQASNIEDIKTLLINAPEEMLELVKDEKSMFYVYLNHIGYADKIVEILEELHKNNLEPRFQGVDLLYRIIVILNDRTITPFKLEKYKTFTLTQLNQLVTIPKEIREIVLSVIKNKSFDNLLYPWMCLLNDNKKDINSINTWDDLKAFCED